MWGGQLPSACRGGLENVVAHLRGRGLTEEQNGCPTQTKGPTARKTSEKWGTLIMVFVASSKSTAGTTYPSAPDGTRRRE
jgi:hypothetical protein